MNSAGADAGIESELIDLDGVPLTQLRELDSELLGQSMHRVVERTRHIRARYRSGQPSGGERVD
jgi:FXSXX-COOH protein